MTVMSQTLYDNVRKGYGIVAKLSVIPRDPTETCYEVF